MKSRKIGSSLRMVLVTTARFNEVIEIGDPVSQAKIYQAQLADELIFLDLDARSENRNTMVDVVKKAAEEVFMPFTVGGGVNNIDDFSRLLNNGADKVSVNTTAVNDPSLITKASEFFGAQCVVVSIDYKKDSNGEYSVWINGGKEKVYMNPIDWAIEAERLGAGEILVTSIDRDGTAQGLDNELTSNLVKYIEIPIISAGGCGLAKHFIDGFKIGMVDAVSAGSYFSSKDQNPMQARSHIKNAGIPVRTIT